MKILVECKPDYCLVKILTGVSKKHIDHAGNNVKIIKKLLKTKNAIGLIDEDPGKSKPKDFRKFSLSKDFYEYGFSIYKPNNPKNKNLLIILKPRLEEWFLRISKKNKLCLEDYGLSQNPNRLHKIINANLKKFEKALRKLLELKSKELLKIKEILGGNYGG